MPFESIWGGAGGRALICYAPDLREQIEALPEGTSLIGISTTGQTITVDLDSESPHVLVCTAGGGGSTTVVPFLDPERISHLWAKALPTVTRRGDVAGIHDALLGLAGELKRRKALADVPRLTQQWHVLRHDSVLWLR
ncbi:hypothetical protein ACF073_37895 [Streptomyces sp. NPDC015171]|uniref:hypothetical protein n=1 Tax=Streptomyces sp. NPDC015171 TaxID=3364945 RepID=UPI0036FEC1D2